MKNALLALLNYIPSHIMHLSDNIGKKGYTILTPKSNQVLFL